MFPKIGVISAVNNNGFVDVLFEAENNKVTTMPLIAISPKPNVKDQVICVFTSSGQGICLGRFYYNGFSPNWT